MQACLSIRYDEIALPQKIFDATVSDFAHSIGLLFRRVRAAANSHDLSLTEAAVMARLEKAGPTTTADLARAESMKPQSMRTTVAVLEEAGMVQRKPHSTDGRQLNIELTAKGLAVRKNAGEAKRTWLAQAIAQLDEEEGKTFFKAG